MHGEPLENKVCGRTCGCTSSEQCQFPLNQASRPKEVEQPTKNLAEKLRELKDGETLNVKTWEVEQPVQPSTPIVEEQRDDRHERILSIVKDRVAQKHGYADYLQIDMVDLSLEEKQEIKDRMTNEIAYEFANYSQQNNNTAETILKKWQGESAYIHEDDVIGAINEALSLSPNREEGRELKSADEILDEELSDYMIDYLKDNPTFRELIKDAMYKYAAQLSPSSTATQGEETYTRSEVEGLLNKFCNEVMVGQSAGTIPKHSNGIAQYIIDNF